MANNFCVYVHTLFDGRKYVGITSQNPKRRWRNGEGYKGHNLYFYNAIQKYGWDAFSHEIVANGLDEETAKQMERELIERYSTQDRLCGFNLTGGGDGLYHPSEEMRAKIGEWSRRVNTGRKHTEEYKKMMSDRMKENNPNAGGKCLTPQRIEQFREYAKQPKTDAQKKKMSESAKKRKVKCLDTNEEFKSMRDCAEKMGIKYPTLTSAIYRGNKINGLTFVVVE